ncbi:hypothetical protein QW131_02265 [Roseibium salinum]|nr:hypothetical protein [Roseibium salinum]
MAAAFCLYAVAAVSEARASVMPGGNSGWLVVASRPDVNAAISVANGYAGRFPQTTVFQSNNGWYAVTLGWMGQPAGNAYRSRLISSGAVPDDSYFHNGERFQYVVWSATGLTGGASQALFAATVITDGGGASGRTPPSAQAYVRGLDPRGDNFLSLRTGPGSGYREISRLREKHAADDPWTKRFLAECGPGRWPFRLGLQQICRLGARRPGLCGSSASRHPDAHDQSATFRDCRRPERQRR